MKRILATTAAIAAVATAAPALTPGETDELLGCFKYGITWQFATDYNVNGVEARARALRAALDDDPGFRLKMEQARAMLSVSGIEQEKAGLLVVETLSEYGRDGVVAFLGCMGWSR